MKRVIYFLLTAVLLCNDLRQSSAQNTGVNTTTPEAALDINGDIIIRPAGLTVDDGITLAMDVNTIKYSYYRLTGPAADFTIAGITAGIDGRIISLFNRSGFTMHLNNEDATVAVADMIVTGTGADLTLVNKGMITLQYDGVEQKWIVKSSNKGNAGGGGGNWDLNGSDIFNTNTGNVGIGITSPTSKLTVKTDLNNNGFTHIGGADEVILHERIGGVSASIGTATDHIFRLVAGSNTSSDGKVQILPDGNVIVGNNFVPAYGKFTVRTPNNNYGIAHTSDEGNILSTRIGGSSAGIGTFSNTNMRIFCNSVSAMIIDAANGNVGIGTETTNNIYKLSVNGPIRAKEIRVNTGWADYVFEKNYKLRSLPDLEQFIKINKRLPGIPAASKLKKEGVDVSEMQTKMMAKIEELTLYLIEANKTIEQLRQRVAAIEKSKQ